MGPSSGPTLLVVGAERQHARPHKPGATSGLAPQVRGRVTYNGRELGEFQPRRTAALVEQGDTHVAQLTVRETLDFAARCQGAGNRAGARRRAARAARAEAAGSAGARHCVRTAR
jgi:ABC-type multidrug transport system ATPase subunit